MKAWDVVFFGKVLDRVFYLSSMSAAEVALSLIYRGEYPPGISVRAVPEGD